MADVRVSALTAETTPTSDDLLYLVNDPGGTPQSRRATVAATIQNAHGLGTGVVQIVAGVMVSSTTLQAIAALDATTESTIEGAIDTLANLTSVQGRTVTLSDPGADAILGWDDSADAYEILTQAEVLAIIGSASLTASGVIEIATAAETTTGTDATRAVSPDGLAGSNYGTRIVQVIVYDGSSSIFTGDGKAYFNIPPELNGFNLVDADACVTTASSSGTPTIQINNVTDTVDMLSTRITIDANELTSYTAAAPPVINASFDDVATGDQLRIDVDVAGTGTTGLRVILSFQLP